LHWYQCALRLSPTAASPTSANAIAIRPNGDAAGAGAAAHELALGQQMPSTQNIEAHCDGLVHELKFG
jgi:hypothetical protein